MISPFIILIFIFIYREYQTINSRPVNAIVVRNKALPYLNPIINF